MKGPRSTTKEANAAPLARKATLRFELRGRPFPLPVVTGTVAGQPTTMLVDTGANAHVLAGWLVRKLGLPMKKLGEVGADHVGRSLATYRVDRPEIAVDGWGKLGVTTALATEVPEAFEKLGIGAFISPQTLEDEGDATIVDLARGELRSAWWDAASEEMTKTGTPLLATDQGRTCEDESGPVKGLAFVVPARIGAHETQLLVDTGAQRSDVFLTSAPGKQLDGRGAMPRESMYTVAGKVSARTIKNARITAGAFATTIDVDLIDGAPDASCPRDGALAMDVLRACTLLFGRARMLGRCSSAR